MDAIETGTYVAYQGNNGPCIVIDDYSISKIYSGFLIESNNTILGANCFCQRAVLRTNAHWQMQELQVKVKSLGIGMNANVKNGKVSVQQKHKDIIGFEQIVDLQNDKYIFQYSGALIIPMIWLRGFDFDNYEKVIYQMLPAGFTEVKQLPNTVSNYELRNFSLLMYVQNFTDIIKIQTDMSGKVVSLHSERNQLTIKKQ